MLFLPWAKGRTTRKDAEAAPPSLLLLPPQNDVRSDAKCVIYRPSASCELRELLWLPSVRLSDSTRWP